jgi:pseudaminic acid biosynthesis-associated methylase
MKEQFSTSQENFWASDFGKGYIERNENTNEIMASKLSFFSTILKRTGPISSCLEFGANIGLNLLALKLLMPNIYVKGIEINADAANRLKNYIGEENVYQGSVLDYPVQEKVELALIKCVLIHINPDKLDIVYEKLYNSSNQYILVAEYFNPTPTFVNYRGTTDIMFKRDFAGEMLNKYPDLRLMDYGFVYKRDIVFPQDDVTWFLLSKKPEKD